jgi:hypothetical protein
MIKNGMTVILTRVDGFDPNRPDLNEFLNSIVVEALADEPRVPRRKRASKKKKETSATARTRLRRRR